MSKTGFPEELLRASELARKEYFKNKFFNHAKFEKVMLELMEKINMVKDESILNVYGPPGVGKSAFARNLNERLVEIASHQGLFRPGTVPVCHIITRAATTGKFSWPEYNRRLLDALKEPLIDNKIKYEEHIVQEGQKTFIVSKSSLSPDLNGVVEAALRNRKVSYLIVDEAQHMAVVSKSAALSKQLDVIKSIANVTNTIHILVGTYALLYVLDLSGQLARRDLHVHFPRYHKNEDKDMKEFSKVIKNMWLNLPLKDIPEHPISDPEYFYDRTIGCVGNLHDWFYRTLSLALYRNSNTITEQLLAETALRPNQRKKLEIEAREGEEMEKSLVDEVESGEIESTEDQVIKRSKVKGNKRNVGERNPKRDPVGEKSQSILNIAES